MNQINGEAAEHVLVFLSWFLGRFDSALCNHACRDHVIPRFSQLAEKSIRRTPLEVGLLLNWLSRRGIVLKALALNMNDWDDSWVGDCSPVKVHSIQTTFCNLRTYYLPKFSPAEITTEKLSIFLHRFSELREVDCTQWGLSDQHLKGFRNLQCPLEVLKLCSCGEISASTVVQVVSSVGPTLKELSCELLNDQALREIARTCPNISKLNVACQPLGQIESLVEFCARYGDKLEELMILGNLKDSSSHLTASISYSCPNLKVVTLCDLSYSIASFRHIMDNCQLLEAFSICDLHLQIIRREEGSKGCRINSGDKLDSEFLLQVCQSLKIPMIDFSAPYYCIVLTDEIVHLMADKFGKDIVKWSAYIPSASSEVIHFFERCPNLSWLDLGYGDPKKEIFEALPKHCSKIVSLTLANIDEGDVVALLASLRSLDRRARSKSLTFSIAPSMQTSW